MNKILLIGGCGFIGRYLFNKMELSKNSIFTLCRNSHSDYTIDLNNYSQIKKFLKMNYFDKIIHLASTGMGTTNKSELELMQINVNSLENLLNLIKENKLDTKFYYISSLLVDSKKQKFESYYCYTKYLAEEKLTNDIKRKDLNATIIRVGNTYSERQPDNQLFKFALLNFIKNQKIILNYPKRKRHFLYIDDVVNNLNLIINSESNEVNYHSITSRSPISIYQFVKQIAIELNLDHNKLIEITELPDKFNDQSIEDNFFDIKYCEIGYKDGIKKSVYNFLGEN